MMGEAGASSPLTLPAKQSLSCCVFAQVAELPVAELRDSGSIEALLLATPGVVKRPFRHFPVSKKPFARLRGPV
jgi:hypothetical protein